ncbi:Protein SPT3 [Pseudozyma hubeiensis]|nr:Protein SPT3 [Pseudozyma hubeiensis]
MSKASTSASTAFPSGLGIDLDAADAPTPEYRYQVEIAQMMFVFADVVDPTPDVTRLVEDIVRSQTIEMIIQSRRLSQRRASKYLSPEDLIFLIRYDRAKVNRLRTYLSWKDVRKNAKDSGDSAGGGSGAPPEIDEDPTTLDGPNKATKMKIRLPWEISSIYSEHLLALPNADGEEDEDDDDLEAHEASMQRLKDADEATRRMTREEYVHYSECRQASFTFRKSKKFREFINASAYLDVKPNDDIIDILGFLAFEVVRELCLGAVAIKKSLEDQTAARIRADAALQQQQQQASSSGLTTISTSTTSSSSASNKRKDDDPPEAASSSAAKKPKLESDSADDTATSSADQTLTHPQNDPSQPSPTSPSTDPSDPPNPTPDDELCTLFTLPPSIETPLLASHIQEAFSRLQRRHPPALASGVRGSAGPGGLRRTRVFVI